MLSKETVLEIIAYCDEHKISRKDRLAELGIPAWQFYESRSKWMALEKYSSKNGGTFIQLAGSRRFRSSTITETEREINPGKAIATDKEEIKIECQTARGGLMRMTGRISPAMLSTILQNL